MINYCCLGWKEKAETADCAVSDLTKQLREKEARIARLEQACQFYYVALNAFDGAYCEVADEILDEAPQQSLAHIQAEAVEKAIIYAQPSCYTIRGLGNMLSEATLYRYAQQLRDKADNGRG